jgi:hypothetical protein
MVADALPVSAAPAEVHRSRARELVRTLAAAEPRLLALDRVDLAAALEQQIYFALRDAEVAAPKGHPRVGDAITGARLLGATGLSLGAWQVPAAGRAPIAILARDPTHYPVIRRLADQLRDASAATVVIRTGRAAGSPAPAGLLAPRLDRFVGPRQLPELWAFHARLLARLPSAARAWPGLVGQDAARLAARTVRRELPRIALGAEALSGAVRRLLPGLLVAFDEVGTWARLLPAVARRHELPSLDLPHAEASDAAAIRGAGYDRMAVYGPMAAGVLRSAGIPAGRVTEIGAPRFDTLVAAAGEAATAAEPRRVVYAAQYPAGAMSAALLELCFDAAVAVAREAAAAELVVVPHPADARAPQQKAGTNAGTAVRVASGDALHRELPGAWVMVTGWSNSVFEAAIAGVPSITVAPAGVAPVDFAAAGLALGATDPAAAAALARSLLDPAVRNAAVMRARATLPQRIGPLDGHATHRAAELVLRMARGDAAGDARMAGA